MSSVSTMSALAAILPVNTKVAVPDSVHIQKGLAAVAGADSWPVLILHAPHRQRSRITLGPQGAYGWVHDIMALYLEKWESSTRPYEEILAGVDADLQTMCDNLSLNPNLVITSTQYGRDGADDLQVWLDGRVDYKELGFPCIQGRLLVRLQDVWDQYSVSVTG
jgi:hypothetical protein